MVDVTLLICTRNRGVSLERTLESIARAAAAAPGVAIEIVVVDNGSTDDTPRRLASWRAVQPFRVDCLCEPRPGLARARNAGLVRARGRIVAMTDDDCILHRDYFTALAARFANAPAIAIIGGRILPGDPADLPVTIKVEDHPMTLAAGEFPGGFVMGANLAFTRATLADVGPFDTRFGAGAPLLAAEDTDWLFRAAGLGVPVEYDPGFTVDHHHGRRRQDEVVALLAGYSHGDGALYAKHLFRDRRVMQALRGDLADLWRDLRPRAGLSDGIRLFYLFRLRHKIGGMLAFWRTAARRS